jgi:hypothetical protein
MLLPPPRRYHRIMSQPLVVEQSRAIPVEVDKTFDRAIWMDAPTVFRRWYGPFPPTTHCARQALEELSKQLVR